MKKLYVAPQCEVIEMEVQTSLMQASRGGTYGNPIDLNNNG